MSTHVKYLNTRYRDQLIRELQVLALKREVKFSEEVVELMAAAAKDGPREAGPYRWWRRYVPVPEKVVRRDDTIFPSDLYLLEATLIEHLDAEGLRVRIAGFRDMLSNLLTEESYAAIAGSFKDLACQPTTDDLLPEARSLISRIYRRYAGVPAVEDIRSFTAIKMILTTVLGVVPFALIVGIFHEQLAIIGFFGAVGATLSTIERLYRFDPRHEPFRTWLAIKSGAFTLMLSPVVGFVFASIVYLLINAGLLGGDLFPDLDCLNGAGSVEQCGKSEWLSGHNAKLFAWGFLAGWAERMVPDVLSKLVPDAHGSVKVK